MDMFTCDDCGNFFEDFEKGGDWTMEKICRYCYAHQKNLEEFGVDDEQ
jgi:hypothetical protein